ncbi:hypothetical protein FRC05_005503 [Tulasnella sp. 425]|nr:hypothetical protein FRC05_005503 [Tulasnella sp. 425]
MQGNDTHEANPQASGSGQDPHPEFQLSAKLTQKTPHQFALLTFNGAEILRLSNFPPNAYPEGLQMGVSEFIMADRLWNSKSIKTERFSRSSLAPFSHIASNLRAIKLSSRLPCRPSITIANVESVSPARRVSARTADVLRAQPYPEEPPSHLRPKELYACYPSQCAVSVA